MNPDDTDYNWIDRLPKQVRTAVHNTMSVREFPDGELIYHYGDEPDVLLQIKSGLVELSMVSEEGKEVLIHIMKPGDCFGEMGLINGSTRIQTASARGDTRLLTLGQQDFNQLRQQYPQVNEELLNMQCRRVRLLLVFMEKSALSNIRQILAQRLLTLASMFGEKQGDSVFIRANLSQEELGKMVGASRQSINKELNVLQQEQILQLLPEGILIKDMEALERVN